MAKPSVHKSVPFFVGILISNEALWNDVRSALTSHLGEIDFISGKVDFEKFTDYYKPEMGENLVRFWVAFKELRNPEELVEIKWICTEIENDLSIGGKRRVNIDPGYLTEAKIILASFKNFSHRIYLSRSVFADMQSMFVGGRYVPMRWTFADYKSDVAQDFFQKLRVKYREWLKSDV